MINEIHIEGAEEIAVYRHPHSNCNSTRIVLTDCYGSLTIVIPAVEALDWLTHSLILARLESEDQAKKEPSKDYEFQSIQETTWLAESGPFQFKTARPSGHGPKTAFLGVLICFMDPKMPFLFHIQKKSNCR